MCKLVKYLFYSSHIRYANEFWQSERQAENEARLGLDFVSLLLSKNAPTQASMSMSPFLSSHVPPGTLSLDKWETTDSEAGRTEEQELVAKGWTSKSLGTTATSLERASARLRQQVDNESRYWDQILSISQEGWSITRATRGSHLLGVKFSMTDGSNIVLCLVGQS